ncbi:MULTISPECIES: DNA adenine methylase [unclassified Bacillus (in: firmicutes)]|uniref:DNA adenine methylase n=1 Tax=unclassified Bacillus (in: firmicutes) TaxID=185979 RepID=UPI0008F04C36|nr:MULTISPECIES: DNA adenine methylase [unclassified Bacillus (in: firmicutes)]SFA86468.1 adenine-specific DNA-methyltransferase [Bacillus sp. UNCCL13]SFQ83713.1 adenine-specific DNA-methyltransferase [Bacillus sp. cl95]
MRYIGTKTLLIDNIQSVIEKNIPYASSFLDIFSGTATVARNFKNKYQTYSNDQLYFSFVLQKATIENDSIPSFEGLKSLNINDPFSYLDNFPLENYSFTKENSFIWKNYSPHEDCDRMYFSIENAKRIDFIRNEIEKWYINDLILENEYYYLLAGLIEAVPYISNISGTFGAYLKHWDKRALKPLEMVRLPVTTNNKLNICFNKDANQLIREIEGDILYIDPPYNTRQYLPNYHLLETIAKYDYPEIYGVTGLRPYKDVKSKYCNKKDVITEFSDLIENAKFKYIVVSYSNEGIMDEKVIVDILNTYCDSDTVKVYKIPYRRYKGKLSSKEHNLHELIFFAKKESS